MTTTRRYSQFLLALIALVLLVNTPGASQEISIPLDEESRGILTRGVLEKKITIVPQLNKLNFGLGRYDGISFYLKKSLSRIFFQDRTIEVTVTDIDFNDLNINLELYHPVLGEGTLEFVFDQDLLSRITDADLLKIILTSLGDENNLFVFADPESKIFHLYSCLHTRDEGKLTRMTIEDARRQGFRECAFCFKKVLYLPDMAIEMKIEKEWSELLLDYEPLIDGSARQAKLSNLGKRILRNWPFPLLGYDYSFRLIKSSNMNAIAIPTGKIVVSTALFEALENEEELEALLLLAITHVEMRHSLKQNQMKLTASQNSDAMKNLVKAAGSVAGIFPGGSLLGTLGSLSLRASNGNRQSLSGFDDDFARQADDLAALYFDLYHENRENLRTLIQKMQLAHLTRQLHPELGDQSKQFDFNRRIKQIENIEFLKFSADDSFVFKPNNKPPVQLDLLYQSILDSENRLVVHISDRQILADYYKADKDINISISVQGPDGTRKFKLLEKFTTEDLWGAQLVFMASAGRNQGFNRDIQSIKLELAGSGNPGDKREEQFAEQLTFEKGKLVY
jgi:hypothetical protein